MRHCMVVLVLLHCKGVQCLMCCFILASLYRCVVSHGCFLLASLYRCVVDTTHIYNAARLKEPWDTTHIYNAARLKLPWDTRHLYNEARLKQHMRHCTPLQCSKTKTPQSCFILKVCSVSGVILVLLHYKGV
jgi:hypothetical protein